MKLYFLIIGCFCLTYYLIICMYSRRLRSTFTDFWIAAGGTHLLVGCVLFPSAFYRLMVLPTVLAWTIFLITLASILRPMLNRKSEETDCIIVLGAQVRGTMITNSLKRRLDAAVDYLNRYPNAQVIVSGGQGRGEAVSEAYAMAEYLAGQGISRDRISMEDRSTSTRENFRYSSVYTDPGQKRIGIVTNDFHIYRASVIARQEGYQKICLIPASSNPVFQLNYLVREVFAVLALRLGRMA